LPKIVDHDMRRRELSQAAVRLIARDGLDAATTRALASESGWTTGVLKHYFVGKDDLLRHALLELEAVNRERLAVAEGEEATGYDALRAAIVAILRDEPAHAKVWIAFLSRAATDPAIGREMRRGSRAWQRRWAELVRRGQADRSIRSDVDADEVAIELWALLSGLRIAALFNPSLTRRAGLGAITLLERIRSVDAMAP
jgi:AcrR family transcriptional regulator